MHSSTANDCYFNALFTIVIYNLPIKTVIHFETSAFDMTAHNTDHFLTLSYSGMRFRKVVSRADFTLTTQIQ